MKGVDVLRDKYGNRIGEIQINGSKQVLVDRYFVRLGSYDSHDHLNSRQVRKRRRPRKRTRCFVEVGVGVCLLVAETGRRPMFARWPERSAPAS